MQQEIWKDVIGYEGLYQVSNFGKIKSLDIYVNSKNGSRRLHKGKVLKNNISKNGYYSVILCKNGKHSKKLVHRLVADAFIENKLKKKQVNHIDGNKTNNTVNNLEWCTPYENMQHAYNTGLINRASLGRKPESRVICVENGNIYNSAKDASRKTGINAGHIYSVLRKERKTAGGFHWEKLIDS